MKNKYLWTGVISMAVLALDQATKYLILSRFQLFETKTVIPGFFNIVSVRNRGAAFGILAGASDAWRGAFFITATLAAVFFIGWLLKKSEDRISVIAFALIAGGAAGNLIDRLRFGVVVDFIDWYVKGWHWPTFNIADSAITTGVVLLAIDMLFLRKEPLREA